MGAIASHLWQSTLVAAVAAALAWLLRQNRASVRYWIWFAASMKFLVPFAALSAVARALPRPDWAVPDNEAVAAMTVVFRLADLEVGGAAEFAWWPIWAVSIAGTCLVLARWSWEWNRVSAIARAAEPITDGPVHDALRRLESANGIQSPTTLVSSQQNLEPGVVGVRTPVLLWPRRLADGMHRDHIESIVAHELSHVMRRDNLLALVHMMVSAAFWFHPVVWWIGTRLVEERERACDEQVLALGQSPASYAAGILKTCELCVASSLANVPGIGGGDLKMRITRIMRNDTIAPLGRAKTVALAVAALAMFLAPFALGISSASPPYHSDKEASAAQKDDGQPVRPGGDVKPPRLKKEVKPQYSARAIQEKIEGEVLMECVVKADGTVGDITIIRSLILTSIRRRSTPRSNGSSSQALETESPLTSL